jgi:hypothetical protein
MVSINLQFLLSSTIRHGVKTVRFTPKTEAQIKSEEGARNLWPRGVYDFEVMDASDEVSSKGNEMIKLRLKVYDQAGNTQTVWDYLLEQIMGKFAHACEAMGLTTQFDSGNVEAADFEGKSGQVVLYVQKGQNGYPDKNSVADYVRPQETNHVVKASAPPKGKPVHAGAGSDLEDEIPF